MLIEIVREFSRPLSLSIRLFVNITVGHTLCLVGFDLYEFVVGSFIHSLFLILMESVVFLIQRYIFSRLVYMYMGDWFLR
jgi:F0F1-type ATP synthase membrane subunit a